MLEFLSNLIKRNSTNQSNQRHSNIVLGMIMLREIEEIDFEKIKNELRKQYILADAGDEIENAKGAVVFQIENSFVALMLMYVPIPKGDLELPIQIAYQWPEAKEIIPFHKAHILISVSSELTSGNSKLYAYKTFTKVAASILANTPSIGIYLGNQTLVLPTRDYIDIASSMTDDDLPLLNWIYFGLRHENDNNSGYTFGLKEFGFHELEILNSSHSKEEIHELLFNLSHYVIQNDVVLNDGETIGVHEDQKLKISFTKGVQLEGMTLKIEY